MWTIQQPSCLQPRPWCCSAPACQRRCAAVAAAGPWAAESLGCPAPLLAILQPMKEPINSWISPGQQPVQRDSANVATRYLGRREDAGPTAQRGSGPVCVCGVTRSPRTDSTGNPVCSRLSKRSGERNETPKTSRSMSCSVRRPRRGRRTARAVAATVALPTFGVRAMDDARAAPQAKRSYMTLIKGATQNGGSVIRIGVHPDGVSAARRRGAAR